MTKLTKVDNPKEGSRVEGPLLHFDNPIAIKDAAEFVARVYQRYLKAERGIKADTICFNNTEAFGLKNYRITVDMLPAASLYEIVGNDWESATYILAKGATTRGANSQFLPLEVKPMVKEIDREKMFADYIGKDISDVINRQA